MDWIIERLKKAIADKFTGSLRINFFKGGISNVNWEWSEKP
jgi:hypothetical protein